MAFAGLSLADGQVAATWGTIYTPTATRTAIKKVLFFNTSGSVEVLEVGITRSGSTRRQIGRFKLVGYGQAAIDNLVLSFGDVLVAQSTNAATVDYIATGASE